MTRPYMQAGIAELEALFAASSGDRKVLSALAVELRARTTDRAARLRVRVLDALEKPAAPMPEPAPRAEGRSSGRTAPTLEPPMSETRAPPREPPMFGTRAKPRPPPPVRDRPEDILSAWTALEVLSPQTYVKPEDMADGDGYRIARMGGAMPWAPPGERSRPKKQLFYQVVLGVVRMDGATDALLAAFVDKHQDRRSARGFAPMATVTVDKEGRPVEDGIALSSFAWGVPLALKGDLVALGGWPDAEKRLVEALDRQVRRTGSDGKAVPLDARSIRGAFEWLSGELGLHPDLVEAPTFSIRVYHYFMSRDPPDAPLMGSFYLGDLAAARRLIVAGTAPTNLRRYLGIDPPAERKDVLRDPQLIEAAVAPGRIPPGRWPAPGRHPLVLLQQAAVNLAASDLPGTSLMPVNGPPGTGKTTLLRDLVAALVVGRAEAMCAFDDPASAFVASGDTKKVGNATIRMSRLDGRLRGFEMLVASSNNKAVENVSRELPALKAIADDATGLRYFKTVADNFGKGIEAWGLVAAALGNASNRYNFREAAWVDPDKGLRTYLAEAAGSPQLITEQDPARPGETRQRKPVVVVAEKPPKDRTEAIARWKSTREAFRKATAEVRAFLDELEAARKDVGALAALRAAASAADVTAARAEAEEKVAARALATAESEKSAREKHLGSARSDLGVHGTRRPGLFARLARTAAAKAWNAENERLGATAGRAEREHRQAVETEQAALRTRTAARATRLEATKSRDAAKKASTAAEARVATMRERCGPRVVDADFLTRPREVYHLDAPWLDAAAQAARDRVFELAMATHKAFVDAAAAPLRDNLESLFGTFYGRSAWSPRMKPLMPDLWASLFLVVPVVSTTFASVDRMLGFLPPEALGFLPPEALGWLLVDEAGQATPQAVVGAMTRARRAVVVGDPLQVPPVTTLPTELAETICREFGVDPERWNAPAVSVQAVADATTTLGAEFAQAVGTVRVGFPLLVHRRCAEPMFSLSNGVAYSNLMLHATPRRVSAIREVLGPSHWVDVPGGRTEDKWCEQEGEAVVALLRRLSEAGVSEPDLFVVTPFVIVAQRLRERIKASGVLQGWTADPYRWTTDKIGTVHTVQGREADSVIFVLGAPLPTQQGARGWAGGSPNILNVAATRAQENLYVVGARAAWQEAGVFRHLAQGWAARLNTPENAV